MTSGLPATPAVGPALPPPLLLLTDRSQLPVGRDLVDTVARCAAAGLEAVVLRELDLDATARAALATALAAHVPVIAARTALPAAVGVHERSGPPAAADGPPARLRGRSCHTPDDVQRAVADGADYVTISPVFRSASKPGYGPALGVDAVRAAVAAAGGTPVLALGGVDPDRVAVLRAAGAFGVAVMGAVMRAEDPAGVVEAFLEQLR